MINIYMDGSEDIKMQLRNISIHFFESRLIKKKHCKRL